MAKRIVQTGERPTRPATSRPEQNCMLDLRAKSPGRMAGCGFKKAIRYTMNNETNIRSRQ